MQPLLLLTLTLGPPVEAGGGTASCWGTGMSCQPAGRAPQRGGRAFAGACSTHTGVATTQDGSGTVPKGLGQLQQRHGPHAELAGRAVHRGMLVVGSVLHSLHSSVCARRPYMLQMPHIGVGGSPRPREKPRAGDFHPICPPFRTPVRPHKPGTRTPNSLCCFSYLRLISSAARQESSWRQKPRHRPCLLFYSCCKLSSSMMHTVQHVGCAVRKCVHNETILLLHDRCWYRIQKWRIAAAMWGDKNCDFFCVQPVQRVPQRGMHLAGCIIPPC